MSLFNSNCPACGYGKHSNTHHPDCPHLTDAQARKHLEFYVRHSRELTDAYWNTIAVIRAQNNALIHENNQLRKKLHPGKC